MIIKLSFGNPELIPSSEDAIEYLFRYEFVDRDFLEMPEEVSETKYYKIKVSITNTLVGMWQLSADNLLKVLYEYTKRYLMEKIIDGSITDNEEFLLSTDSHPNKNPFDYLRIHYLESIDIETQWKIESKKVLKRKKTRKTQPQKAKITDRETIKQKMPIDAKVKDDSGNDPNIILALDSEIVTDASVTGDLDLGYENYINAFEALIDKYGKNIAPLTIGIHGEWGSGKTSFMRAIRKRLKGKKYVCIWFNAWKYREEESIWKAFLRHSLLQVGNSLGWWKKLCYKLKLLRLNYFVVSFVVIVILIPVTYGVSQVMNWKYSGWLLISGIVTVLILEMISKLHSAGFDLGEKLAIKIGKETSTDFMGDIEKDMQDFIKIYTDINNDEKPLIVFIDDLDRCPPERIVGVMNAINTITYLENTIFFLGYDINFVGMAIGKHYSNVLGQGDGNKITQDAPLEFGLDFLDKIVQIPFRLPRPGFVELNQYIEKALKLDSVSSSSKEDTVEREKIDYSNAEIQPEDGLGITDDTAITIEGPDRENLAAVTAAILSDGVEEFGLSNIRQIKRFINTFRLLYEISSDSGLLRQYKISPQQLGYFLFFHLFSRDELAMQVSYMKELSFLKLEDNELRDSLKRPEGIVIDKLNIVFTDKDNREIEKYRILDQFVRGSVN